MSYDSMAGLLLSMRRARTGEAAADGRRRRRLVTQLRDLAKLVGPEFVAHLPTILSGYWSTSRAPSAGPRGRGRAALSKADHVLAYTAAQAYALTTGKVPGAGHTSGV